MIPAAGGGTYKVKKQTYKSIPQQKETADIYYLAAEMDLHTGSSSQESSPQNPPAVQYFKNKRGSNNGNEKLEPAQKNFAAASDTAAVPPPNCVNKRLRYYDPAEPERANSFREHGRGDRSRDEVNMRAFFKPTAGKNDHYAGRQASKHEHVSAAMASVKLGTGKGRKEVRFVASDVDSSPDVNSYAPRNYIDYNKPGLVDESKFDLRRGLGAELERIVKEDKRQRKAAAESGEKYFDNGKKPAEKRPSEVAVCDNNKEKRKKKNHAQSYAAMAKQTSSGSHSGYENLDKQYNENQESNAKILKSYVDSRRERKMKKQGPAIELLKTTSHPLAQKLSDSLASSKDGFHIHISQKLASFRDWSNMGVESFVEKSKAYNNQLEEEKPKAFLLREEESEVFGTFRAFESEVSEIKAEMDIVWGELETIDKSILELVRKAKTELQNLDKNWLTTTQKALEAKGKESIKQMASMEKRIANSEVRDKQKVFQTPW